MTDLEPIANAVLILADKLGIAVEKLIQIYTEPQSTLGFLNLIFFIYGFLMWLIILSMTWTQLKGRDNEEKLAVYFLVGLISAIILLILSSVVIDSIMHMKYPLYYGTKEIVETMARLR